jgi:hypothetical protein
MVWREPRGLRSVLSRASCEVTRNPTPHRCAINRPQYMKSRKVQILVSLCLACLMFIHRAWKICHARFYYLGRFLFAATSLLITIHGVLVYSFGRYLFNSRNEATLLRWCRCGPRSGLPQRCHRTTPVAERSHGELPTAHAAARYFAVDHNLPGWEVGDRSCRR